MAFSGRMLTIQRETEVILGARTENFTISIDPVDITDKGDSGWRTIIADPGGRMISASIEGVVKDDTILADMLSGTLTLDGCRLNVLGMFLANGDYRLADIQMTGEMADAVTFSATLESAGPVTFSQFAPYVLTPPVVTVTGGANSGNLSATQGTWAGTAPITFATTWQTNTISALQNHPGWINAANEAAAETRHAAGDFVRVRVVATNVRGIGTAFSNVVT